MDWQYILTGIIVFAALMVTFRKMAGFFKSPASKCEGCSGCTLKEITNKR
jgi:hypothetical protein